MLVILVISAHLLHVAFALLQLYGHGYVWIKRDFRKKIGLSSLTGLWFRLENSLRGPKSDSFFENWTRFMLICTWCTLAVWVCSHESRLEHSPLVHRGWRWAPQNLLLCCTDPLQLHLKSRHSLILSDKVIEFKTWKDHYSSFWIMEPVYYSVILPASW